MEWILVGDGFVEADVIRWNEPVYHNRRRGNGRPIIAGHRQITAQVLHIEENDWVDMEVLAYLVTEITPGRSVPYLQVGERIGRHRKTIARGDAHRLEWSDESARSLVRSKFMGISDAFEKAASKPPAPASPSVGAASTSNQGRPRKPGGPRLTP